MGEMVRNKGVGVSNRRSMKHNSKNKTMMKNKKKRSLLIQGIVNYLKSDSYFYSHLLSSSPSSQFPSPPPTGLEMNIEPVLKSNEGKLREKVVEYLKSDTYLYAPLQDTQPPERVAVKAVVSPPEVAGKDMQFMRVTSSILSKKIVWQRQQVEADSVGGKRGDDTLRASPRDANDASPRTPEPHNAREQVVRRSYRLSSISGT